MSMSKDDIIAEGLARVGVTASSREVLLRNLATELVSAGRAKESFVEALIERERQFPTGLPTRGMCVAIPHTDVEHVIAPTISVTRLASPLVFGEMGGNDRTVEVELVLVLAMKDKSSQLGLLQSLIGAFSDVDFMASLRSAPGAPALVRQLKARTLVAERLNP